jgi:hypothetical protein
MAEERKYIARMQIIGGAETRAEVEQTAKAVESGTTRMQDAFNRVGSKAEGLDSGFKKLNRGVNDARGAIELLGGAVPGLDTVFGVLSKNIGNVSDVFGTLSGLFLKNPIGIAAAAISAAAAAFIVFSKSAGDAAKALEDTGKAAVNTATDWQKLVDPIKTVAGLIDAINSKKIDIVGGQRNAIDLSLGQRRQELERLRAQLASNTPAEPSPTNAQGQERLPQELAALRLRAQRIARDENQNTAVTAKNLESDVKRVEGEIKKLEQAEAELRTLEASNVDEFAGRGESLKKIRDEREAKAAAAASAGAAAAAEQARQLDALVGKYAPAIKAENELTAARASAVKLAEAGALQGERYEAVLRGIADAEFNASAEGQKAAEVRAFAARVTEEVVTAEEKYAEAIKKTDEALAAGAITAEQAARKRELEKTRLQKSTQDTSEEAKNASKFARDLGLTFSSAFENAVAGGKKVREVLRGLGEDLLKIAVRKTLTEPFLELFGSLAGGISGGGKSKASGGGLFGGGGLGSIFDGIGSFIGNLFADGAAFDRGNAIAFASGGNVVDRPTLFPMSRGRTGLMGEAGPEAILPLARGLDGRLGVAANQNQGRTVVVNIDARGSHHGMTQQIRQVVMQELAPMITDGAVMKVEQRANLGGSFSRAVGRRGRG